MLTDKVQAKVEWDVTGLFCDSECGIIFFFSLCFTCLCLSPCFPTFIVSHKVHLVHLAIGGLLTSTVSEEKLVFVFLCKSGAPVSGQHRRGWPGSGALDGLIKLQVGERVTFFSYFCLASDACCLITGHLGL